MSTEGFLLENSKTINELHFKNETNLRLNKPLNKIVSESE